MKPLRPYQQKALAEGRQAYRDGKRSILFVSPTGCHRAGQLVIRHDGSVARVEDIQVGEQLMGPDGEPRTVLELCRGAGEMVTIHPVKGEPWTVNMDHVLSLVRTEDGSKHAGKIVDVTVRDWLGWSRTMKHVHKLFRVGASFGEQHRALPIDPYLLGLLLGDGCLSRGTPEISTMDHEVISYCRQYAAQHGLQITTSDASLTAPTYRFSSGRNNFPNPLMVTLQMLGLCGTAGDKFIPSVYKTAPRSVRLALLAGLIDTDGHLENNGYDFISKSRQLADDLAFVARSLGLAAYITPCEKFCQTGAGGTYFRLHVSGHVNMIPCRVARRIAAPRQQIKDVLRTGFSAETTGTVEPFFGFCLDGDRRYLLGDFTVTHNSGKTRIGSEFVVNATKQGRSVLWLAHRKELLTQARDALIAEGVGPVGVICAALPHLIDTTAPVQIASIQTLLAREGEPKADLVILDEAHHAVAAEFLALANKYTSATRLGLTATPVRSDGTPLGDLFDALVPVASVKELTDLGFLTPAEVIGPDRHQGKDLAQDPVAAWQQYAHGERTVVFARSVEHSKELCARFREVGARSEHIDGATPAVLRDRVLEDFKLGRVDVLCNVFVLTEGFDAPGASCCILARGCGSLGTFLQMVGRVLRPSPGKTRALILDLPGVVHMHGLPDDEREYSLDGEGIKSTKKLDPLRTCKHCGAVFRSAPACPRCGEVFPVAVSKPEITGESMRRLVTADLDDAPRKTAFLRLVKQREERGYKPGWEFYRFVHRFGVKPNRAWGEAS